MTMPGRAARAAGRPGSREITGRKSLAFAIYRAKNKLMKNLNRRAFVKAALAVGALVVGSPSAGFAAASRAERSAASHPLRLGGPVFGDLQDPEELARAHRQLGYRAAYCPNVALTDSARIHALAEAFARHDVVIAEVGRWVNLMEADTAKQQANLKLVIDGLALADAIGARCCVDIAGSRNPHSWFGPDPRNYAPDFFDAAVENARKIIDAVKPRRARFTYEMMGWAFPDSADTYLKLIRAIDRRGFGVHLDPCNAVNCPDRFYRNTALLNECFDKLGRWIASCHAKDLTWDIEMNVHFREVQPGLGALDYPTYLARLARLPGDVPLMIEHLASPEEYGRARDFIVATGKKGGLAFE